jgi:hypothetical protein
VNENVGATEYTEFHGRTGGAMDTYTGEDILRSAEDPLRFDLGDVKLEPIVEVENP